MVIYNELVTTTKEYMRNIITIEPKWLVEVRRAACLCAVRACLMASASCARVCMHAAALAMVRGVSLSETG